MRVLTTEFFVEVHNEWLRGPVMSGQEGEKPQEDTEWGAGRMRERGGEGEEEKEGERERERERERGRVEREKTRRGRSPLMSKR